MIAGIHVVYRQFHLPEYPRKNSGEFVPGIRSLFLLFHCGIQESRRIFRDNALGCDNEE